MSCLPSDFGGELESVEVLHNKFRKELADLKQYYSAEERQWSESLTIDDEKTDENKNVDQTAIECLEID